MVRKKEVPVSRQSSRSTPKEPKHRVFVYGTLRQGESRRGALEEATEISKKAYLIGFRMYHLGGFPGIIRLTGGERGEAIVGELYQIDKKILDRLDIIEGHREEAPESSFYRRTEVRVLVPKESEEEKIGFTTCWTYIFNNPARIKSCPVIESGDWFQGRDM